MWHYGRGCCFGRCSRRAASCRRQVHGGVNFFPSQPRAVISSASCRTEQIFVSTIFEPNKWPKWRRSPVTRMSAPHPNAAAKTGWSLAGSRLSGGQTPMREEISHFLQRDSNPSIQDGLFAARFRLASSSTPGCVVKTPWDSMMSNNFLTGLPSCAPENRMLASRKIFTPRV